MRTLVMEPSYLADDLSLDTFVRAFEACTLPKAEWTHAAHVAVGTVYLRRYDLEALPKIRTAIQRYNASQGGPPTAYHETLTIFWLSVISEKLQAAENLSDLSAVQITHKELGKDSRLFKSYYSFDVVASQEARAGWVAPDLISVDMPFALE